MKKFGPALLITAAFIGPGTVTTASMAGANFGYALVWALLFSVIATFVLQEMAARLGLVTGRGLAEAIRNQFSGVGKWIVITLVVSAIGAGNAAYQAGNLTGAALGLSSVMGGSIVQWVCLLATIAIALLISGKFVLIEKVLIALVLLMSLVFLITMLMAGPDFAAMFTGLMSFSAPTGSELMIIALIGTTVVPYNLFLHASIVARKPPVRSQLNQAISDSRMDSALSIGIGGVVTFAVLSCAATAFFATQTQLQATNIALQLEPLLGTYANLFFATGLFAAGLTSSITAPLAAAYAVCGALGWRTELTNIRFKIVWLAVIVIGVLFASLGIKPLAAILFAQATNGLLLPIIALFLIYTMNNKTLLGEHKNGVLANLLGGVIVLFVSALGLYKLSQLFL
ncbi:Nramp family divalent metal transporter [Aliiglaciecola sp. LCG003]|uniref:Nramp family divalent metal transporter n=1 Tax=Aliiglaciecola sp. LCG003 TaxID=3053655 RepID=UPI002572F18B|nr:Nramp family divalent metal transporter [Aliiglaciecola sp. LCG003]WJG10142.1 Nramp family divalent metal transporter [Aliiglaciecola sp. LCG003]